jgi:glycosyltransferase involved in cell wall biosynthesis
MNKVNIHTTNQPDSDTTAFILSCDRLEILDQTLKSFLSTRDYVTRMVIVDDSARPGIFESLVEKYGDFSDVICFPRNRSQWWAMDFMVSYCDTEYVFYVEDDWLFLQSGYLEKSRRILQKYRNIGNIDISLRTFEEQGFQTREPEITDGEFYYKKLWRISDYHFHWYGWTGSPNLKRRDDLLLLGRVEKWHNEWNIDRRFLALGLKSVYLADRYVEHLGDHCSRMEGRRPDDGKTPEDFYPVELLPERVYPKFDYFHWDTHWQPPSDITLVTALIDLQLLDKPFESRYLASVSEILKSRHPLVIFSDPKYNDYILSQRQHQHTEIIPFGLEDLENMDFFSRTQELIHMPSWYEQADWMKDSVIRSFYYIPFTLTKQKLLTTASEKLSSSYYYWLDPDMFSSYGVSQSINDMYFTKVPRDRFFMLKFPFVADRELHGFNSEILEILSAKKPSFLVRGTVFGGTKRQIHEVTEKFYQTLQHGLNLGTVGAEEAIYTILSERFPSLLGCVEIPTGDIRPYLESIR